jgi:hypothetical protein
MEGRSQEIMVSTDPPGAECAFYREQGQRIATIQRTPGSASVRKTKNDIWIVCVKPGYQEATYFNRSGAAWANVVGGVLTLGISTAVDSSTGAGNEYQSPANIVMVPNTRGAAEGLAVLPQTFTAEKPAGSYSQQVASPRGAVSAPGEPSRAPQPFAVAASAPAPPPNPAPTVQAIPEVAPGRTAQATAAAAPVPAAPVPPRGQFDGVYSGALEVAAGDLRQVWLRVVGTRGSGSARRPPCLQPGAISIAVAPDGSISGDADVLSGSSCTSTKATVKGQIQGNRMAGTLVFQDGQASREFVATRQ